MFSRFDTSVHKKIHIQRPHHIFTFTKKKQHNHYIIKQEKKNWGYFKRPRHLPHFYV